MKTMLSFALLGVAYCYPETVIVSIIAVLFVLDVISKLINADSKGQASYSMVKEILNDESNAYYLKPKSTEVVKCQIEKDHNRDWKKLSYRELQNLCREKGIKKVNRKKKVLIAALQNV